MTESNLVICTLVMVFIMFSMAMALLWRATNAIQGLAHLHTNAEQRERHDHFRLIEQLFEKLKTTNEQQTTVVHARERVHERQLDHRTQLSETLANKNAEPIPQAYMPQMDLRNMREQQDRMRTCAPAEAVNE